MEPAVQRGLWILMLAQFPGGGKPDWFLRGISVESWKRRGSSELILRRTTLCLEGSSEDQALLAWTGSQSECAGSLVETGKGQEEIPARMFLAGV